MVSLNTIITLIIALAPHYGIDPKVALAVAAIESAYNPKAIGAAGEVGLYQIMPFIYKSKGFTKKQLLDPTFNINVGLSMLREAKRTCSHQSGITFLVCYNMGNHGAKKVKYPEKFSYVRKAHAVIRRMR